MQLVQRGKITGGAGDDALPGDPCRAHVAQQALRLNRRACEGVAACDGFICTWERQKGNVEDGELNWKRCEGGL
jgi:hypothetical protein